MVFSNYRKALFLFSWLPVLLVTVITGCATTVNVEVHRPPAMNTPGISRIAVIPFKTSSDKRIYTDLAAYATGVATNRIRETGYFVLEDPLLIQENEENNGSMADYADALFTGEIIMADYKTTGTIMPFITPDGKKTIIQDYTTTVEVRINYSLIRPADGSLIGMIQKNDKNKQSGPYTYSSASKLMKAVIDDQLRYLNRDLAPYIATETLTLAKDKSKDKTLKSEMKNAAALVKVKNYSTALEYYLEIYFRHNSIAAARNASILYEALGNVQSAADLMKQVFIETGNTKVQEALARLDRVLEDRATLASNYKVDFR